MAASSRKRCPLGPLLEALLEEANDLADAFGPDLRTALRPIDPSHVGPPIELGQRVEERTGLGFGGECCLQVGG